ncbi:hypothetical protein BDY24DRAFT_186432 [Mrakia frigida]|uniref:uncharacterized protein n=1 Tax=Mrakia frigida TaxID=29902 RepID=UPI003FCC204B
MKTLLIDLPTCPPSATSINLQEEDLQRTTVAELLALSLGALNERAGLVEGVDEDWGWGLRGWDCRTGEEEEEEQVKNWDDLLSNTSFLPSPLPSHLFLTPLNSRLSLSFLSVPSIPDYSTLAVYALPTTTAESLVEEVCERMGLVRRMTIGGETKGKGREKWGGGERVEYALEEVWEPKGASRGKEVAYPVPPSTLLTSILLQPLHPSPSKHHHNQTPAYRFCIPQSWLLKPTPTSSTISSISTSLGDDDDADEEETSTTLKASHSTTSHGSLSFYEPPSATSSPSPRPQPAATASKPAGARLSLFDSIYSTFSSSASSPPTTTTTTAASPPQARKIQQESHGQNRNSVVIEAISEPMPAGRGLGLGLEGGEQDERVGGTGAGEEEVEVEEEEFEALMDNLNLHGPQRTAMTSLTPSRKAYLLAQSRAKTSSTTNNVPSSISRATNPSKARTTSHNPPPTSFRGPSATPQVLEQQRTGASEPASVGASWSKRFSVASLGSWGEVVPATTSSPEAETGVGVAGAVVKQNTGGGWGGWWGGGKEGGGTGEGEKGAMGGFGTLVDEIGNSKLPSTPLLKRILSLRVALSTAPLPTINEFLDLGGLDALEGLLGRVVRLPESVKGEVGEAVLLESVRVVRVLSNTEPGFQAVIHRPLLITYITFTLHTSFLKLRSQAADVLAAISVLGGSKLVLAAFSEFRVAFEEGFRFEWLVASLRITSGEGGAGGEEKGEDGGVGGGEEDGQWDWDWRASAMALVNAISNSSEELEERVMLRDELGRRGLNEVIVAMRYMSPPETLITQLDLYVEEKQEDLEDLRYQTIDAHHLLHHADGDDSLDYSLGQLAKLAQEHSELYPVLVDTVKRYVLILEREIDNQLKADLLSVLDKFFEHAAQLDNLDDGWKAFMALFLQSIQPIVPEPGSFKAKRSSPSTPCLEQQQHKGIPSAFVEEIEALRTRVEELSDERAKLKDELSTQIAEVNTFRALPSSVSMSFSSSSDAPDPIKSAEKESPNFHGLVQRLVLKEKEVLRLQAEVTRLGKSGPAEPRESDEKAKRDRDRTKFNTLAEEVQRAKTENAELEGLLKEGKTEIKYLKLALESVHSRFQALNSSTTEEAQPARDLDPQIIATEAIESLTRKEEEIISLRTEVESLKRQLSTRRPTLVNSSAPPVRSEQDFKARVAPPPPPPSILPKPQRSPSSEPSPPSSNLPLSPPPTSTRPTPPTVVFHPSVSTDTVSSVSSSTSAARPAFLASITSRSKTAVVDESSNQPSCPASQPRNALMAALSGRKPIAAHDEAPASEAPSSSEVEPRRALMAALRKPSSTQATAGDESSPSTPTEVDPRRALMAALRNPNPPTKNGSSESSSLDPPARPNLAFLSAISNRNPSSSSSPSPSSTPSSNGPPGPRPAFLSGITSRGPPGKDGDANSGRAALMAALGGGGGGASSSRPNGLSSVPRAPPKPIKKLKPFFWKKLASDDLGKTIWNDLPEGSPSLDLGDLEDTFMMGAPSSTPSKMSLSAKKHQPLTLLDITRSNNVGIMLARLKLPIPKIQQAVLAFDDETLTLDDLKALSKLLPTSDEIGRIGGFEDVSKLAKPDQYFKEIMTIPRLVERFDCMLFRRRLEFDVAEVVPDLQGLTSAARELKDSTRFKGVLQVVLAVGNALNVSTFRGGAGGFGMDALLKLKETRTAKPTPECPTLLHFIAKLLIKTSPSLVLFIDEMPHLPAAARISFTSVLGSVSTIVNGLDKVRFEIDTLRDLKASPPADRFIPVMFKFSEEAAMSVERIKRMGAAIDGDLKGLLAYFGEPSEGPESTRPEDFFAMVLSFSIALQKAAAEVTKHLAPSVIVSSKPSYGLRPSNLSYTTASGTPSNSLLSPPLNSSTSSTKSVGKGDLDEAIRSLHGGQRRERERDAVREQPTRPLSKIFLDGSSGNSIRGTIGTRRKAAGGPRAGLGGLFEGAK